MDGALQQAVHPVVFIVGLAASRGFGLSCLRTPTGLNQLRKLASELGAFFVPFSDAGLKIIDLCASGKMSTY